MTIRPTYIKDISSENEIFILDNWEADKFGVLAGLGFETGRKNIAADLQDCLDSIYAFYDEKIRDYSFWFVIGTNVWQENNRIIRHKGLSGILNGFGFNIDFISRLNSISIESREGIKFFGASVISEYYFSDSIRLMVEFGDAYFIIIPERDNINDILSIVWSGKIRDDINLISEVKNREGILIGRIGYFDDTDAGLLGLGS